MQFGAGLLAALAAVIREGSFERAARILHVTPSAVSQRVKQLEEQVGAILVQRTSPCVTTPVGAAVYRHALQVELLERDLMNSVVPGASETAGALGPMQISIAVNADSLATWLTPALAKFASQTNARIDVVLDDQAHTAQWLRSGRVLGAVTSDARPVQGCKVRPLGVMRYLATATPRFVRRWFANGTAASALRAAPSLAYNRTDRLCEQLLAEAFACPEANLHAHLLPSPNAYVEGCLRGLGWGMNPQPLVASLLKRRRLTDLAPGRWVDVPLFWQQWSLSSTTVDTLAQALYDGAEASLLPMVD